jgi:beta-galactosidase
VKERTRTYWPSKSATLEGTVAPGWWKSDIDSMVLGDRNHPSVIMWSIGNEISERSDPDGVRIAKDLSS